jgi:D-amino peptidase
MVLVGIHAMGGTPCAITPHSLWQVNDGAIYMSEASMAAAIAGDMGIPTVFASGDNKIIAEMTEKIPDITSVITKEALSPYQACSLIPATSCQKIYDGVCSAVKNLAAVKPYRVQGPVKLTLFDNAKHIPPFDELTTPVVADSISEAFMKCEKGMPWTKFDLQDVDGFVYP